MPRRTFFLGLCLLLLSGAGLPSRAPAAAAEAEAAFLAPALRGASGTVDVVVQLAEAPAAVERIRGRGRQAERARAQVVGRQQERVLGRLRDRRQGRPGHAAELGRMTGLLNAVVLRVDAGELDAVVSDPEVVRVDPVGEYHTQAGATPASAVGADLLPPGRRGAGVRVAVIDSGIDYAHIVFGDPQDPDAGGAFPTARVTAGYDFIGDSWRGSTNPLVPDADPRDIQGHGTKVAHVLAGRDARQPPSIVAGVATEATLYAAKVCFENCSGAAILFAMEWALGFGPVSVNGTAVPPPPAPADILNLSLSAPYGQPFDAPMATAVQRATDAGAVVVAAAGNAGNKPFVVGLPAAAPGAIAVGQSVNAGLIRAETGTARLPGAHLVGTGRPETVTAQVYVPPNERACGGAWNAEGSAAGRLVAVRDAPACSLSGQLEAVSQAGGIAAIVRPVDGRPWDVVAGDTVVTADTRPAYIVPSSAWDGLLADAQAGRSFSLLPRAFIGGVVSHSSRGPQLGAHGLKPDIVAPGSVVAAQVGGPGTGTAWASGTSFAAPVVAGAAAALLSAHPGLTPAEVRARLMNTAEASELPVDGSPSLSATRRGAGEVRPLAAVAAPATVVADGPSAQASLSFGFVEATRAVTTVERHVLVTNTSESSAAYTVAVEARGPQSGVAVSAGASPVVVGAGETVAVPVTMTITAAALPAWTLDGGTNGSNGARLSSLERHGFIRVERVGDEAARDLVLPWWVLARRAADLTSAASTFDASAAPATVGLSNGGTSSAHVEGFTLIGEGPAAPAPGSLRTTIRAVGHRVVRPSDGVSEPCQDGSPYALQFAITSWQRQTHPSSPAVYEVWFDLNDDGQFAPAADRVAYTSDLLFGADGRNAVRVVPWGQFTGGDVSAFTGHALHAGNTVMAVCANKIGWTETDLSAGRPLNVRVLAYDVAATGLATSDIAGMRIMPGRPRFTVTTADVPAGGAGSVTITDAGTSAVSDRGVLLLPDGARGGIRPGTAPGREAIVLTVAAARAPSPSPSPVPVPAPTPVPTDPGPADPGPIPDPGTQVIRHAGRSRILTALEISRATHIQAGTVVLARADQYADALAGAPLAVDVGGPLLLTSGAALDRDVAAELQRLGTTRVILLGGRSALSAQVESDARAMGLAAERIAGATRFETAARIGARLDDVGEVVLTEGANADPNRGWPDALGASAFAAAQSRPILLVTRDSVPTETAAAIRPGLRVVVVGGRAAVSDEVVALLQERGAVVTRLSGPTRYATSVAVAQEARRRGLEPATTWLATGRNWPDALAAGAAAGAARGVLLLLDGATAAGSSESYAWLAENRSAIRFARISGGTAAVSDAVEDKVRSMLS